MSLDISWTRPGESGTVHAPPEPLRVGDTVTIAPVVAGYEPWGCYWSVGIGEAAMGVSAASADSESTHVCPPWTFVLPPTPPGEFTVDGWSWGHRPDDPTDYETRAPDQTLVVTDGGAEQAFWSNYSVSSWAVQDLIGTSRPKFGQEYTIHAPAHATAGCRYRFGGLSTYTAPCSDWTVSLPDLRPSFFQAGPLAHPDMAWISVSGGRFDDVLGVGLRGSTGSGSFTIDIGDPPEAFTSDLPAVAFLPSQNPSYGYVGDYTFRPTILSIQTGTCWWQWEDKNNPPGMPHEMTVPLVDGVCADAPHYRATERGVVWYSLAIDVDGNPGTRSAGRLDVVDPLPTPALTVPSTTYEAAPMTFSGSVSRGVPIGYSFEVAPAGARTASAAGCDGASADFAPTGSAASRTASAKCSIQDPGKHFVSLRFRDATGAVRTRRRAIEVLPDNVPPTATAPTARILATAAGITTVPTRIAWTGTDAESGIRSYQLQQSVDGAAWTTLAITTATQRTLTLAVGKDYRLRVRPTDRAGNVGSWKAGATFTVVRTQESSPTVSYGGAWTATPAAWASGGATRYTRGAGASAMFSFVGRSVGWLTARGPTRGKARIYVDGALVTTVDLRADTLSGGFIAFQRSWAASGHHTVKIVGLGTTGRPRIDLDALYTLR